MAREKLYLEDLSDEDIIFRNFQGRADKYNQEGQRNFNVVIGDLKKAEALEKKGWRVIWRENADGDRVARIKINVSYRFDPPKIVVETDRGKSLYSEKEVGRLDNVDYEVVDLVATGSYFEDKMSAYLDEMWIKVKESPLAKKHGGFPESGGCGNCDICDKGCKDCDENGFLKTDEEVPFC